MPRRISPHELIELVGTDRCPLVIDVRRAERFRESPYVLKGALRRDPETVLEWKKTLPRSASVVVYCVHGHEVSQKVAAALQAKYLAGGLEHWKEEGGELATKPKDAATRWVTRERPKIDRVACPWLIRRFVDPEAEFLYVAPGDVLIGLPSPGLRSNGYSLARRVLLERAGRRLDEPAWPGAPHDLATELLEPSVVYAPAVLDLLG